MVLEKTLDIPLGSKNIKPVHPNGNQHWIFIERTNAEAEAPVLWPPDAKSQLIGKDADAYGKRCQICDLQRRFTFKTRDQAWSLKSFRVAEFY